jgi:hypothetical protein
VVWAAAPMAKTAKAKDFAIIVLDLVFSRSVHERGWRNYLGG